MDVYEREDVVEYHTMIFLLKLAEYETLMAKHILNEEDRTLIKIMPELEEGQCCIIAEYHDESCFHANMKLKICGCGLESSLFKRRAGEG